LLNLRGPPDPPNPPNPPDLPDLPGAWGVYTGMAVLVGVALLLGLVVGLLTLARRREQDRAIQTLLSNVGDRDTRTAMQSEEPQRQRTADTTRRD